jgi:hypothetical protein
MIDPPPLGDSSPVLEIIEPQDGATIYGNTVEIRVAVENFDIAAGGHWHVWVNETLTGMVFEGRTILSLEPGTYRVCANLGDAQHMDMGIPDGITINVQAAAGGTPTSTLASTPLPDEAPAAPPQPEGGSGLTSNPVLIAIIGVIAAIGGAVMGVMMGRRKTK